jgi:hypothetical protein
MIHYLVDAGLDPNKPKGVRDVLVAHGGRATRSLGREIAE